MEQVTERVLKRGGVLKVVFWAATVYFFLNGVVFLTVFNDRTVGLISLGQSVIGTVGAWWLFHWSGGLAITVSDTWIRAPIGNTFVPVQRKVLYEDLDRVSLARPGFKAIWLVTRGEEKIYVGLDLYRAKDRRDLVQFLKEKVRNQRPPADD